MLRVIRPLAAVLAILPLMTDMAQAQKAPGTLHVILVSDTGELRRTADRLADLKIWTDQFKEIEKKIAPFKTEVHTLKDDQCSRIGITNKCNSLKVGANDAVFFWYNGHGFHNRKEQKLKWPALDLRQQGDKTNLKLTGVYDMLAAKRPRLLLVSADTCNVYTETSLARKKGPVSLDTDPSKAQYKALFVNSKGNYISSGSEMGQVTWTGATGSYYTIALRNELWNAANRNTPVASWDKIFGAVCGNDLIKGQRKDWDSLERNLGYPLTGEMKRQIPQYEKTPTPLR